MVLNFFYFIISCDTIFYDTLNFVCLIAGGTSRHSTDIQYFTTNNERRVSMSEYEKNLVEKFKEKRGF